MQSKKISESRHTMVHRVAPGELNSSGNMHGGYLMLYLDEAAAICALRHARTRLVTAAIEYLEFISPIKPRDLVLYHCSLNYVGTSSMEVGVRIEAENLLTGTIRHVATSYVTFVAIDEQGNPCPIPPLEPENEEDARRMADGARRIGLARLQRRQAGGHGFYLTLEILPQEYAVCRLEPGTPLPPLPESAFVSVTCTDKELALILPKKAARDLPASARVEAPFTCLRVKDTLDINTVGLLFTLTSLLAASNIPVLTVSTMDTNYFLVRTNLRDKVITLLKAAGHTLAPACCP